MTTNDRQKDPIPPIDHKFRADRLREWAQGSLPHQACVELLIRSLNGRLLEGPWIFCGRQGRTWFDAETAKLEGVRLRGVERHVLDIAMSLASTRYPVDLGFTIPRLDQESLTLVLQVLAYIGSDTSNRYGDPDDRFGDEIAKPRKKDQ